MFPANAKAKDTKPPALAIGSRSVKSISTNRLCRGTSLMWCHETNLFLVVRCSQKLFHRWELEYKEQNSTWILITFSLKNVSIYYSQGSTFSREKYKRYLEDLRGTEKKFFGVLSVSLVLELSISHSIMKWTNNPKRVMLWGSLAAKSPTSSEQDEIHLSEAARALRLLQNLEMSTKAGTTDQIYRAAWR